MKFRFFLIMILLFLFVGCNENQQIKKLKTDQIISLEGTAKLDNTPVLDTPTITINKESITPTQESKTLNPCPTQTKTLNPSLTTQSMPEPTEAFSKTLCNPIPQYDFRTIDIQGISIKSMGEVLLCTYPANSFDFDLGILGEWSIQESENKSLKGADLFVYANESKTELFIEPIGNAKLSDTIYEHPTKEKCKNSFTEETPVFSPKLEKDQYYCFISNKGIFGYIYIQTVIFDGTPEMEFEAVGVYFAVWRND